MLIDTHCHIDFPEYNQDRGEVISRAKDNGIEYIINIGSSLENSAASVELAKNHACVYAAVGVHPHDADRFDPDGLEKLETLARHDKVVAIGEIGLDYFKNFSKAENQKPLFKKLIGLSKDLGLPLVIHSRQAEEDILKILKEEEITRAVVHCFSGGENFLKDCLDMGFFISFTCNITYKKADTIRRAAELAPLERILLETDAPYLSPEGMRGKRNEPVNVLFVAEKIAELKMISSEEVARVTTENAKNFFKLK